MKKTLVKNWTNFPSVKSQFFESTFQNEFESEFSNVNHAIARGNGRCYGDASLGDNIFSTLKMQNFVDFDHIEGELACEAGVLLSQVLELIVPKGWFLPITPGTKFITIGGAIASNVHGKNHHKEGAFSKHILEIKLLKPDGSIELISSKKNPSLFELSNPTGILYVL